MTPDPPPTPPTPRLPLTTPSGTQLLALIHRVPKIRPFDLPVPSQNTQAAPSLDTQWY